MWVGVAGMSVAGIFSAGLSAAITSIPFCLIQSTYVLPKPTCKSLFPPSNLRLHKTNIYRARRKICFAVCVVMEDQKQSTQMENSIKKVPDSVDSQTSSLRVAEKLARKSSVRFTYLVSAVMSSFGITSMAIMAVYYRFYWQLEGGEVPLSEMFSTFSLSVGAAVGMEFWARWSHHRPREGPFEFNDVFAITNAVSPSYSPPLLWFLPQRPCSWTLFCCCESLSLCILLNLKLLPVFVVSFKDALKKMSKVASCPPVGNSRGVKVARKEDGEIPLSTFTPAVLESATSGDNLGVITPYEGQRAYIVNYMSRNGDFRQQLYKEIEGVGFLNDPLRRIVALTYVCSLL